MKIFKKTLLLLIITLGVFGLVSCNEASYPSPRLKEVTDKTEVLKLQNKFKEEVVEAENPSFETENDKFFNMEFEQFASAKIGDNEIGNTITSKLSYRRGTKEDDSDLYYRREGKITYSHSDNNEETKDTNKEVIDNFHIKDKTYYEEKTGLTGKVKKTKGNIFVQKFDKPYGDNIEIRYEEEVEEILEVINEVLFDADNQEKFKDVLKVYTFDDGYAYKFEVNNHLYIGNEIAESGSHLNLKFEILIKNNRLYAMQVNYEYGLDSILDADFSYSFKLYSSDKSPFKAAKYEGFEEGKEKTIYLNR